MIRLLFAISGLFLVSSAHAQDKGSDFFEKKIRPILVEQCYQCHSVDAKKQRGGLYLDSKEALLQGGDSGPSVIPGKPGESLLIKAIRYDDPEMKMPPKAKLPAEVILDFEKWVAMGAPDPRVGKTPAASKSGWTLEEGRKFWCYQPVQKPDVPKVKDAAWPRTPLDHFILAKLEAKNVHPTKDADKPTLLRRVYFALLGLPPTPGQIDVFVRDTSPNAFPKVVDELLQSPHFGERWGRHWLDLARFSESSGGGRSLMFKEAWRYRDYVIRSFNNDLPYNRFLMEQIAGDLLPAKTPEERASQLTALGFLMLGPTNYERQDKPVLEMDVIDEQLDTIGKGFLGMTIGCARCHDHKFDPIPTKDYYAMAGIFRNCNMLVHQNVSKWVEVPLPTSKAVEEKVRHYKVELAELKEGIRLAKIKEGKTAKVPDKTLPIAVDDLPGIVIDDVDAKVVGNWKQSTFSNHYVGKGYLYDDRGFKAEETVTFIPEIKRKGMYEVRMSYIPNKNRATNVRVRIFHADGDNTVMVNQQLEPPIGRFISLGRYRFERGSNWFVMISTEGVDGHVTADAVQFLREEEEPEPKEPVVRGAKRTLAELEADLKRMEANAPSRPMAMGVTEGKEVNDFYVCIRGNFFNKGEPAPRGVLQVATLGKAPVFNDKESGRRELAEWLASPRNPLTPRVMVNRLWHHLFGAGIVRTVDNFGITGELPSHPELLDYLASCFMEEGWSTKKLIREMVLSRTWQLSSATDPVLTKADPENRLLGRANRRRLEAEPIRDTILVVSGQLDRTIGGLTVRKGTTIERDYQFDDTRRSVYTPIFRNRLMELFEVFDFADPNMMLGKRNISTVSTQALFLLNSPFAMDQAKAATRRILAMKPDNARRLDLAYRQALGRLPTDDERQLALDFLKEDEASSWEGVFQVLFACVDFRYVN